MSECFEYVNNYANAAKVRALLPVGAPPVSDEAIEFYLEAAAEAVCNKAFPFGHADADMRMQALRKYSNIQLRIALALIAKIGVWGETAHSENGINRTYDSSDVPKALLDQIVPFCKVYSGS